MRRAPLIFCCLLLVVVTNAQRRVSGNLVAADSRRPLASANVFIANTSFGTNSSETGSFSLTIPAEGKYELIVSLVGYETYRKMIEASDKHLQLSIELQPMISELQEVIVSTQDPYGWDKWGNVFLEHFMGTSAYAEETTLLNRQALRFYFNEKTQVLTIRSKERLRIENKALGYLLYYDMELFEYSFAEKTFLFRGYPFFEEMKTERAAVKKKWVANRLDAYRGSLMHFARSLIDKQLKPEGFEVRQKVLLTAYEKKRVKETHDMLMRYRKDNGNFKDTAANLAVYDHTDTLAYFKAVLETKPGSMLVLSTVLPADSIAQAVDSISASFVFKGHLDVLFPSKKFPAEYGRPGSAMGSATGESQVPGKFRNIVATPSGMRGQRVFSDIYLVPGEEVIIYKSGIIEGGHNLLSSHYWAWWEKMSNKLPYDYSPSASGTVKLSLN